MPNDRFIFAGGGTGGHLFPGIAIAQELKKLHPGAEILFVGAKDKIEARVVPQQGFGFRPIWISGFHRRRLLANLLLPLKVVVGMAQAIVIVRKFSPAVVVGTGGYVSGPVVYAATLLGIPTVIQDQNGAPGSTTKFLSRRVNEVHLTFESSKRFLTRQDNILISGNPTRDTLDNVDNRAAAGYFGFDPTDTRKTVLVFGGSLGAASINAAVRNALPEIMKRNVRLIWQTGAGGFDAADAAGRGIDPVTLCIRKFIERMEFAYAVSTLVLCRAGATTIAELTRVGKPAILVPYPFAAANHQAENARMLADAGAAAMIADDRIGIELAPQMLALLNDAEKLHAMSERSRTLAKPHAAQDIARHIAALAARNSRK